jgi:hypothetical protein
VHPPRGDRPRNGQTANWVVFDRDLSSFDATATLHSHASFMLEGYVKLYCGKYEEVGYVSCEGSYEKIKSRVRML